MSSPPRIMRGNPQPSIQDTCSRKRKVLVYKSHLLPYSETFIREQVRMLPQWRGVLVGESLVPGGLSLEGLDVRLIGMRNPLLQRAVEVASVTAGITLPSRLASLRSEAADLLHIHFGTDAYTIWPLAKKLGLPTLVTLHGYDINTYRQWWEAGRGGRKLKGYPLGLLEMAGHERVRFLAVSQAIKKRAIEFGIPANKITVSPIGVDTQLFKPGGKPICQRREVLYVGRLVEKKGCRYLLQAFAEIQPLFPEYELVIVGDGPLEAELKATAQQQGIRVRFLGPLTSEQVQHRMHQARVLCLPSITARSGDAEGLGIVILEAQACGVPVVTSARGGAQEAIVPGESGIAHEEKDVAALKEGLTALLRDDELAARFGSRGRQHVTDHMDLAKCVLRLEQVYEEHAFGSRNHAHTPHAKVATSCR